jgi:hypothetical protein
MEEKKNSLTLSILKGAALFGATALLAIPFRGKIGNWLKTGERGVLKSATELVTGISVEGDKIVGVGRSLVNATSLGGIAGVGAYVSTAINEKITSKTNELKELQGRSERQIVGEYTKKLAEGQNQSSRVTR